MVDTAQLSKLVRSAMKSGKYTIGARESMSAMKGTKALLCTKSIPAQLGAKLREEAQKHGVAVVEVDVTSAEFARIVGRPYRVSALALKSVGEAELKSLMK
jgi:ribosomal protein L30E